MMAYEMLTLEKPFKDCSLQNLCMKVAVKGERPKFDCSVNERYKKLIEKCWNQSPDERPTFEQIKESLKNDKDFLFEGIDKERFYDYVEMIDSTHCSFDPQKKFQKIFLSKVVESEDDSPHVSVEFRDRKIEVKEVINHDPHSWLGDSSKPHTHYTIFHVTRREQRTVKTDSHGNKTYSEWTVVPGTEEKKEVASGMERGFTNGYERDI